MFTAVTVGGFVRVVIVSGGIHRHDGIRRCMEHVVKVAMIDGRTFSAGLRKFAVQRGACERRSRQAQHQQNDSEKTSPVNHGARV